MRKVILLGVVLLVLGANNVWAQAQQSPPKTVNAWVVGGDYTPAGLVRGNGLQQPFGTIHSSGGDKVLTVDQQKDPWVNLFGGYKPLGHLGFEVRFQKLGTHGTAEGSVGQTEGTLDLWGKNDTPGIFSSAPVLNGPLVYTVGSSMNISSGEVLVNYSRGFPGGWVSGFGGLAVLRMESTEDVTRAQKFLLYTLNPNRSLSSQGIREDYNYSSIAASTAKLLGPTGGIEGELCIFRSLFVEGRVGVAMFPWGSTKLNGQFSATKDIYLVNVAGGVNATPIQTIDHKNWAPNALPYNESFKQSVTAIDAKVGIKWRVKVGRKASLNLGMAIARSSLNNMPITPGYVIKDPFAVGNGRFGPRTANMSVWAPMFTAAVWF